MKNKKYLRKLLVLTGLVGALCLTILFCTHTKIHALEPVVDKKTEAPKNIDVDPLNVLQPKKIDRFLQPAPLYFNERSLGWNNSIPDIDASRATCQAGPITSLGYDQHCNDYFGPLALGTELSGIQKTNPHEMLPAPFLYYPFCSFGAYVDSTSGPGDDPFGLMWDFSETYPQTGCWGVFDPIVVPVVDHDLNPERILYSNAKSDNQEDQNDNVTPFFGLGSSYDPVSMAFDIDVLTPKGQGDLPISVAIGDFVDVNIGKVEMGSLFDVAILRRGAGADDEGYVNLIANMGFKESYSCYKDAFSVCGSPCADDPIKNADACNTCLTTNPVAAAAVNQAIKDCGKTYEYIDDNVYEDQLLEGTKNPVFIFSFPKVVNAEKKLVEATGSSGAVDTTKLDVTRLDVAKILKPAFAVVNRGGSDCFGRDGDTNFIRYRNPGLDPNTGIPDGTTKGITYYNDSGSVTMMPGDTGKPIDRCGYLTLYAVVMQNNKPIVKVMKQGTDKKIIKIPLGFNPVMCAYGRDHTGDSIPDIICANNGNQAENIYGSFTVVSCPGSSRLVPPYDPAKMGPVCKRGYIVHDFPVDDTYKAKHPWWLTDGVLRGKGVSVSNLAIPPKDILEAALKSTVINPADFAATYSDAYMPDRGVFTVHLNDVDDVKSNNPPNYRFQNDLQYEVTTIDTESLGQWGGDPKTPPIVTPLSKKNTVFPLAITSGLYSNLNYHNSAIGNDALSNDLLSSEFAYGGYIVRPTEKTRSLCRDLVVGFNNGRRACVFRNQPETVTGLTGVSPEKCTGTFATPKSTSDCFDTSTAVYNMAHKNDIGNWGIKYLAPTHLDLFYIMKSSYDTEWGVMIRAPISVNLATQRSYKTDSNGQNFAPKFFHSDPSVDYPYFDFQFDVTHDMEALMGPMSLPPDLPIGAQGASELFTAHPHLTCDTGFYEMATVITKTRGYGRLPAVDPAIQKKPKLKIWVAGNFPAPHRCYQRHMMADGPAGSAYGQVAAACCLKLETPESPSYIGYDKYLETNIQGENCPGLDPMECCILQNILPFRASPPTIDWDTLETDAIYEGEDAMACVCGDVIKHFNLLIAEIAASDCGDPNPQNPQYCQDLTDEYVATQAELCECYPAFPFCDEDKLSCDGFTDPLLKKCCEEALNGPPPATTLTELFQRLGAKIAAGECGEPPDDPGEICEIIIKGDVICSNVCCVNIINNGGNIDLTGAIICSPNIECGDPCEWGECPRPPAALEECPSGFLTWDIPKPEESVTVEGKTIDTIFRAAEASLVINLDADRAKLLKTLKIVPPEEDAMKALSTFKGNIEIRQTKGTMPEIEWKDNVTVSSVKNEPIKATSLIASGLTTATEKERVKMTWSLQCPKGYVCEHDELQEMEVTVKANGQTVTCPAQLMRRGGIFGGACNLIR